MTPTRPAAPRAARGGLVLEPDAWLAGIFGHPVFKVVVPDRDKAWRPADGLALPEEGTAFYYARVPTARVDQVRGLCAAGFTPVDVGITLERAGPPDSGAGAGPGVVVRDLRPADVAPVLEIAVSCFVYSRFHLDPHIPAGVADAVKREWVRSYVHNRRGERLLVAEADGRAVGFLAVLAATEQGRPLRVIDLIGVARDFQGRGVGRGLVEFFVREYGGRGLLRVGTQAANLPSLRLYEQARFRVAATAYTLHAHVRDGKVLR
jgi:ribosomal protein S18 acetylase RimI-like enzyme